MYINELDFSGKIRERIPNVNVLIGAPMYIAFEGGPKYITFVNGCEFEDGSVITPAKDDNDFLDSTITCLSKIVYDNGYKFIFLRMGYEKEYRDASGVYFRTRIAFAKSLISA